MREELSIPLSVALRFFNEKTGADCKSAEDMRAWMDANPEGAAAFRRMMQHHPRRRGPEANGIGTPKTPAKPAG